MEPITSQSLPDEQGVIETITPRFIRREYYLRGRQLAWDTLNADHAENCSTIFVCPFCAEIWGHIHTIGDGVSRIANVTSRYCDRHDHEMWSDSMAGCFSKPKYPHSISFLPVEIVRHDFNRLMLIDEALRAKK